MVLALGAAILLVTPVFLNINTGNIYSRTETDRREHIMRGVLGREVDNVVLTWEQYESMCHKPAWERSSVAHVQQLCSPLEGW